MDNNVTPLSAEEMELLHDLAVNETETVKAVLKVVRNHVNHLAHRVITEADLTKLADHRHKHDGAQSVANELYRVLVRERKNLQA